MIKNKWKNIKNKNKQNKNNIIFFFFVVGSFTLCSKGYIYRFRALYTYNTLNIILTCLHVNKTIIAFISPIRNCSAWLKCMRTFSLRACIFQVRYHWDDSVVTDIEPDVGNVDYSRNTGTNPMQVELESNVQTTT